MKPKNRSEGVSALHEERNRLRNHNERLMDELKTARRRLKKLEVDYAALIQATNPDSRSRLLASLSKILNTKEENT